MEWSLWKRVLECYNNKLFAEQSGPSRSGARLQSDEAAFPCFDYNVPFFRSPGLAML